MQVEIIRGVSRGEKPFKNNCKVSGGRWSISDSSVRKKFKSYFLAFRAQIRSALGQPDGELYLVWGWDYFGASLMPASGANTQLNTAMTGEI